MLKNGPRLWQNRPTSMSLKPGTRVGSYEIGALIGAGGMGASQYQRRDRIQSSVQANAMSEKSVAQGE